MAKVILVKGFTENDRVHVRSVVLFGTTGRFCPAILSAFSRHTTWKRPAKFQHIIIIIIKRKGR